MAHKRESIRKAFVTAVTGLSTTGSNVFSGATYNLEAADLPALVVLVIETAPETPAEPNKDACGAIEIRALPITVEAKAKITTDLLDTLDDIAAEVETAVTAAAGIAALVTDIRLISTGVELQSESEKPVGVMSLDWIAEYSVNRTAPSA